MSFHFFGPDWDFQVSPCLAYREISWAQIGSSSFALHVLLLARALGCWSAAKKKNVELQSWLLVSNPLADQLEVV